MGILNQVFEVRGYSNTDDFWYSPIGMYVQSKAGIYVNRDTAMRVSAVYACTRVIADAVASLPLHLYRRLDGGGKERATEHWAYNLLRRAPLPRMTAYQWKQALMYHLLIEGNFYAEKQISNAGDIGGLIPWNPEQTDVKQSERGDLIYELELADGKKRVKRAPQMLHIYDFSWNGLKGVSRIAYARESIGLAGAAEEFGARFYSNGTNVGTIYTMPEGARLSQEQLDKLVEDLRAKHAGLGSSHQAMLLPGGITASKVSIPPNDAQFLETRKFQVQEIARIFRVPLHMIQMEEKDSSWGTGIESLGTAWVVHGLRPTLVNIEESLNRSILPETEQDEYFFEFLIDGLVRGDMKSRGEFYSMMLSNQVMTPNEVREKENMNPRDGGDEVIKPENLFGKSQEPPPDDTDDGEKKSDCDCGHEHRAEPDPDLDIPRMSIQRSYRRVIRDAMSRVMRRERQDVLRGAEKHLRKRATKGERRAVDEFTNFINEFYDAHREFTREAVTASFTALAEAVGAEAMREIGREWEWNEELERWVAEYIEMFAENYANQSRGQLLAILDEIDQEIDADVVVDRFSTRFDEWELGADGGRSRDDKIAQGESVRLGEGFARAAFFAAGVTALVWRATGSETCPYCQSMNGRTVSQNEFFLLAGADFQPAGAESPLRPSTNIGHPPLHAGCDCVVVPKGF
jgi:HK97 family phage portal protein